MNRFLDLVGESLRPILGKVPYGEVSIQNGNFQILIVDLNSTRKSEFTVLFFFKSGDNTVKIMIKTVK